METFSALLAICAGNSPVPGEFPTQKPVTRSFNVFFDLGLNKRLSKQWWGWWFETPSSSLWRHCNVGWNSHVLSLRRGGIFEFPPCACDYDQATVTVFRRIWPTIIFWPMFEYSRQTIMIIVGPRNFGWFCFVLDFICMYVYIYIYILTNAVD